VIYRVERIERDIKNDDSGDVQYASFGVGKAMNIVEYVGHLIIQRHSILAP
jgi:hypothetical protein